MKKVAACLNEEYFAERSLIIRKGDLGKLPRNTNLGQND